jgi:hypothetical protein
MEKKLTQKAIRQEVLPKIETLSDKLAKLDAGRIKELHPHVAVYNEAAKPIEEKWEKKIAPVRTELNQLKATVEGWLKGLGKVVSFIAGRVSAANNKQTLSRVIGAKDFFALDIPHDEKFWACVKIEIGPTEELLGKKRTDEIADKPTTIKQSITIAPKK